MGQIIVRNLDDGVIARLKQKAKKQNQSLEQTVRDVLTEAAKAPAKRDTAAFAAEMRARTAGRPTPIDPTEAIRDDRDSDHGRRW
jgi:plasmid stability protein